MSDTEIAWAAGFYDGEGCTSNSTASGRYRYLSLQISQAEPTTLHRFWEAVGQIGKVYGPYVREDRPGHHRRHWRYQAHNRDALAVIELLLPYLSEPKREQYLRASERVGVAVAA